MKRKYVIEVETIDNRPDDWTNTIEWPHEGIFQVENDRCLYEVGKYGVIYFGPAEMFLKKPMKEENISSPISEALLLKAIAAASRAEVLK